DGKVASVRSTGRPPPAPPVSGVLHLPQSAALPLPRGGTRLAVPQEGQAMMSGAMAEVECERCAGPPPACAKLAPLLHTATSEELPAIRRLLARSNDAPYDVDVVAAEKCFGRGVAGEPVVRIFGGYDGLSVTCGKYVRILAVDRERRGRGIGSTLLADAESRGATTMAAEPGNYFTPGVADT